MTTSATTTDGPAAGRSVGRSQNPRGQGHQLREDILRAAAALMDEGGSDQAVTLRAVARRVGIAAPSIYAHFPDREAILLAVVQDAFAALEAHLGAAVAAAGGDPVARLGALCAGYLDFASRWPQRYRLMFHGVWSAPQAADGEATAIGAPGTGEPLLVGDEAFTLMVECIAACATAGRSRSTDAFTDAAAVWVALHGLTQLRPASPRFPWPSDISSVLVDRLALLEPSATR